MPIGGAAKLAFVAWREPHFGRLPKSRARLGEVYGDSVLLPGGARLCAQEVASGASFASWGHSPLRRRLRLFRMFAWVLCFAVLALSGWGLAESIQRSLISFVQVPALVTEETTSGRGDVCRVQLSFIFDGQARTGTYDVNTSCHVLPGTGCPVNVKVNPENPQDVVIVGHEASDRNLPLPIGLAGGAAFLAAGLLVIRSEKSWRRAGALGRKGLPWLQITATVKGHKSGMFHEVFTLEGKGTKGQPVAFRIKVAAWAKMPKPDQELTFHLLSDSGPAVILAVGERPWYRLATLSTPLVASPSLSR